MPSARERFPGPRHKSDAAIPARRPRRRCIRAIPSSGSRARIRHGRRISLGFRHRVHEVVNAVVQIHVRAAGWAVERGVACRRARGGVARRIVFADIGFGLDDHAGRDTCGRASYEHLAQEIHGHRERWPVVERAWQSASQGRSSNVIRGPKPPRHLAAGGGIGHYTEVSSHPRTA